MFITAVCVLFLIKIYLATLRCYSVTLLLCFPVTLWVVRYILRIIYTEKGRRLYGMLTRSRFRFYNQFFFGDVMEFHAKYSEWEGKAWVLGWKNTMTWKEKVNDDAMKDGFAQTFWKFVLDTTKMFLK